MYYKFISYLEDLVLVRFKRVELQLEVPQVPKSHGLQTIRGDSVHDENRLLQKGKMSAANILLTLSAEPVARMNSL